MGKVVFSEKNKKGQFSAKATDVTFFWAKLDQPEIKYGTKTGEKEYNVKAIVSEEVAAAFEGIDLNKEFFELKTEYRKPKEQKKYAPYIPLAEEAAKEGKTLFLVTLTQRSETADGKKLFVKLVGRNPNVGLEDKIGNGSKGSFRIFCYPGAPGGPSEGKLNCSLNAVQITDLVEFVESDFSEEGMGDLGFDDFGEEEGSEPEAKKEEKSDDGSADPFAEFEE